MITTQLCSRSRWDAGTETSERPNRSPSVGCGFCLRQGNWKWSIGAVRLKKYGRPHHKVSRHGPPACKGGDQKAKLFQFLNQIGARAQRIQLGHILEMAQSLPDKQTYDDIAATPSLSRAAQRIR